MSVDKEIWKPVKGYEDLYEVSNLGRVRSLERRGAYGFKSGERTMSLNNKDGYIYASLCKDGKYKKYYVHRLVAQAFIPNPHNLPCVNHKDESRNNNCASNLEWCTYSYNINYGTGNKKRSRSHSKPIMATVINTGEVEHYASSAEAGKTIGGHNNGNIGEALNGKRKTAYGRTWKYEEGCAECQ